MDRLWAPWRSAYVQADKKSKKKCFLCESCKSRDDATHYVLERSSRSFSILNVYPYNNGHVLIAPKRHVADLELLSSAERHDILELLIRTKKRLQKTMNPHGFNVGLNCGSAAGAGIETHLHFHIVPRWKGDTNFMPLFAGVRVIPQALDAAYALLKAPAPAKRKKR